MAQKGCKRGEGGLVLCVEYSGNEILSGFVDNAGPSTKPDASGGFAGQIGWKECALQCAVIVRSPLRAQRRRGALPHTVNGTVRRAALASSTRGCAYA